MNIVQRSETKRTLQLKALGSTSILLVQMSKEATLREKLNEGVVSLINDGVIELVSSFMVLDDLDVIFVAAMLFEILSLVRISCEYLTSSQFINSLVSVQRRLLWFLQHEEASKVHRISSKILYTLYNIFMSSCNRVEYLADTSMLRVFYDIVVDSKSWPSTVRKRAVSILVLFSFFPEFGTFLSTRVESIQEITISLLDLAADKSDPSLSSGACLDLIAFVLYQNLTHNVTPRILNNILVNSPILSQSLMASIGDCFASAGSSISAVRLVHVIACYQDKGSVQVWKPLFDSHQISTKIVQLVQGCRDISLLEAGLLACGSLVGAPAIFTWEILFFAQLKSTDTPMSEIEKSIFTNTLARVLYKYPVRSTPLLTAERQSMFAEAQLLMSTVLLNDGQILQLLSRAETAVGIKTALLRLIQVLVKDVPKYDVFVASKYPIEVLLSTVSQLDFISTAVLLNVTIPISSLLGTGEKSVIRFMTTMFGLLSTDTPPMIAYSALKLISSVADVAENHAVILEHIQALSVLLDVEHFTSDASIDSCDFIHEVLNILLKLASNSTVTAVLAATLNKSQLAELLLVGDSISDAQVFLPKFKSVDDVDRTKTGSITSLVIELLSYFVSSKPFCAEILEVGCIDAVYHSIAIGAAAFPKLTSTEESNFFCQTFLINYAAVLTPETTAVVAERETITKKYTSALTVIDLLHSLSIISHQSFRVPNDASGETVISFLLYMWAYSKSSSVTYKVGTILHRIGIESSRSSNDLPWQLLIKTRQIAVLIFLVIYQPKSIHEGAHMHKYLIVLTLFLISYLIPFRMFNTL